MLLSCVKTLLHLVRVWDVYADLRWRRGQRDDPADPGLGGALLPAPPLQGQPEADRRGSTSTQNKAAGTSGKTEIYRFSQLYLFFLCCNFFFILNEFREFSAKF